MMNEVRRVSFYVAVLSSRRFFAHNVDLITLPPSQRLVLLILCALVSCAFTSAAKDRAPAWIEWKPATDRVVSHTDKAAAYPRAKRLSNGEVLLGYHHGGGLGEYGTWVTLRKSRDRGVTWHFTRDVEGPEGDAFWGFSNVDFIELGGGRVMLVTSGRGKAEPEQPQFLSECARSELRLRFSEDYGETWGVPHGVAGGRGRVWEPSVVQLANGDLEIYYANEAPDLLREGRLDQRIEVIRSADNGRTWSEPSEVAQHPGCRNGMPAAIVLQNGRVACAQEVVRHPRSPWITETLHGRRTDEYIAQSSYGFGAAPFLLRGSGPNTFLAFHSGFRKAPAPNDASLSWMFSNVWVQRGDVAARDFGPGVQPWPHIDANTGVFFPSLLLLDDDTLVVLASVLTHGPGETSRTAVRWIEGRLK